MKTNVQFYTGWCWNSWHWICLDCCDCVQVYSWFNKSRLFGLWHIDRSFTTTIALCVYFFPNCFVLVLPFYISCELGELTVVLPQCSLLYWKPSRYCWVLGRSISEWCLQIFLKFPFIIWLTFVYLQDIYHGFICTWFLANVRTNLTSFKVVDQAGPWSVWSQLILVHFK